jgi:pyruvate dehydrogenase E1 component beta subunit
MKYKDAIKQAMEELAPDERVCFIGYNIRFGSRAYGTLSAIASERCIETPVAENLMAGLAIGMAMEGFRPVLFYERHDFMFNALDAIVNHLDKLEKLSHGQFTAPVIIRAVIGATRPLYPGLQHIQNLTEMFRSLFHFPIYELKLDSDIPGLYRKAIEGNTPVVFIEEKNLYESEWKGSYVAR